MLKYVNGYDPVKTVIGIIQAVFHLNLKFNLTCMYSGELIFCNTKCFGINIGQYVFFKRMPNKRKMLAGSGANFKHAVKIHLIVKDLFGKPVACSHDK